MACRQIKERLIARRRFPVAAIMWWQNQPAILEQSLNRWWKDCHDISNELRECAGMPQQKQQEVKWNGFVQCKLSDEQLEQLAAWDVVDGDLFEAMSLYGEKGYKFSIVFSKQNDSWIASMTGTEHVKHNAGWAVTAFAPTPYDAMRAVYFKVACILPDKWTDYKAENQQRIG